MMPAQYRVSFREGREALAWWGARVRRTLLHADGLESAHRTLGWHYRMAGIASEHAAGIIADAERRGVCDDRDSLACLAVWGRWSTLARQWDRDAKGYLNTYALASEREADEWRARYESAVARVRELESEESWSIRTG